MVKLGIIGAMQVEVEILLGQMEKKTARTVAGSEFYEGTLEGVSVVVVQCGVGRPMYTGIVYKITASA